MPTLSVFRYKFLFGILILTALGAFLRLHNLSPFTVYPDSYQSLVVAQNIRTFHSVIGTLGTNGEMYPDYFIWTRPVYPLLISLFSMLPYDPLVIAQAISLLSSVLTIPLSYQLLRSLFRSQITGIAGAFLLTFSYQHTLWSGFIMTESLGGPV